MSTRDIHYNDPQLSVVKCTILRVFLHVISYRLWFEHIVVYPASPLESLQFTCRNTMCANVNGKEPDLDAHTDLPTVLKKDSALSAFTGWFLIFERAAEADIRLPKSAAANKMTTCKRDNISDSFPDPEKWDRDLRFLLTVIDGKK